MYLIYLDENGNTGQDLDNTDQPIHFIAGIAIKDDRIPKIEKKILSLIPAFSAHEENQDFEFHGSDLYSGKKCFKKVSVSKRLEVFFSFVDIMEEEELYFFCQGIHKKKLKSKYSNPFHPHTLAFMYIIEKIDMFLEESNSIGMVIMDHNEENAQQVINDFRNYKRLGTSFGFDARDIKHFIENVLYVKSHNSYLMQLADVLGYIVASLTVSIAKNGIDKLNNFQRALFPLYERVLKRRKYFRIDPK
jgi:hypothetical protein